MNRNESDTNSDFHFYRPYHPSCRALSDSQAARRR